MAKWLAGQSGNPNGRPIGARAKIAERLLSDIADVWEEQGKTVLERLAKDDPAALAKIAYGLLPREMLLSVQQSGPGVDADQWALMRRVLDAIERSGVEAEPGEIFEEIEHTLRARFAKPISSQSVHAVCTDPDSDELSK
jgi:hypothetical protein